ncbi:hypothetical protein QQX98_008114 [Neonectria punicea]|uniref:Uncharacterized protein n=1 Tax=Neonectria punicea TaxID=979145 RepID=A0ABR1GX88_9HYPO
MSLNSPVRLFPCIHCWTPEVKCTNYVFLNRSSCVDCQRARRQTGENETAAAEVHENLVRYLLERYTETDGITYEQINGRIARAKAVHVDNILTIALDYIWRNFRGIYDQVCDEVEKARDKGPQRWTPLNLTDRLEQLQKEEQQRNKGGESE